MFFLEGRNRIEIESDSTSISTSDVDSMSISIRFRFRPDSIRFNFYSIRCRIRVVFISLLDIIFKYHGHISLMPIIYKSFLSADPFASRRVRVTLCSFSSQFTQCPTPTRFCLVSATPTTAQQHHSQTPRFSDSLDSQILRASVRTRFSIGAGQGRTRSI